MFNLISIREEQQGGQPDMILSELIELLLCKTDITLNLSVFQVKKVIQGFLTDGCLVLNFYC